MGRHGVFRHGGRVLILGKKISTSTGAVHTPSKRSDLSTPISQPSRDVSLPPSPDRVSSCSLSSSPPTFSAAVTGLPTPLVTSAETTEEGVSSRQPSRDASRASRWLYRARRVVRLKRSETLHGGSREAACAPKEPSDSRPQRAPSSAGSVSTSAACHQYNRLVPPGQRLRPARTPSGASDAPADEGVAVTEKHVRPTHVASSIETSWITLQSHLSHAWGSLVQSASTVTKSGTASTETLDVEAVAMQAPDTTAASAASVGAVEEESSAIARPLRPPASEVDRAPLGFSFSPAGLLLPYHFGVAECLRNFGVLHREVPISGASAGALAVATIVCQLPVVACMRAMFRVEDDLRQFGAARRLHAVLLRELSDLIPEDAHDIFNARRAPAVVSYTTVWPMPKGRFVQDFTSRADLIECLLASCNIPFYFSTWPTVTCRGSPSVDGYFAVPRKRFGCPHTGAARDIYVLPFSTTSVKIKFPAGNCISPDLQKFDKIADRATGGSFTQDLLEYLNRNPAPSRATCFDTPSAEEAERIVAPNPGDERLRYSSDELPEDLLARDMKHPTSVEERTPDSVVTTIAEMWDMREEAPLGSEPIPSSAAVPAAETVKPAAAGAGTATGSEAHTELPLLRVSTRQMLRMALDATSDANLIHLFDVGRADAFRWLHLEHLRITHRMEIPGLSIPDFV